MSNPAAEILPEPPLEFRYKQKASDPHDGLALFGPYDSDGSTRPANVNLAVVGTTEGLRAFESFSAVIDTPLMHPDGPSPLWPPYPGFRAVFHSAWPAKAPVGLEIDRAKLTEASRHSDANHRAFEVVNLYLEALRLLKMRDENFSFAVCVVPEEVFVNCRPESKVKAPLGEKVSGKERASRKSGQTDLFAKFDPAEYQLSVDFRRQLKARAMEVGIPIQIILEPTLSVTADLDPKSGLTPLSDRAWNLTTTMYYKAGGKPWRLSTARDGVCYIGIAFRKTNDDPYSNTACCAAQMFLDSGDGVVFLGEEGQWYSPKDKQCHLSRAAAQRLLKGILDTYSGLGGKQLKEIFLHCRSDVDPDEFAGYQSACPAGVRLVVVKVRKDGALRLFRPGAFPVIRGTFWSPDDRAGYLWASGFKPRLGTYDGWEVPLPLRIQIQHGDADIRQVAQDIFGLTKLNYNACRLGESEPVTVGFSDAVGEILISNPTIKDRRPNFKFYI